MEASSSSSSSSSSESQGDIINSLPEEILERILSYLSPYGHCKQAALVCRRWHRVIQGVIQQKAQTFRSAAAEGTLKWSFHECPVTPLTSRHSHNMCRRGEHIYVFGGCSSSMTAFNDMWRLNLVTREWSRILALGSYPSPKAAASMVPYKNTLVLFGGWAPPVPYPLHQAPHLFNELQVFSIQDNRWSLVVTNPCPPPTAGHQASVIGHKMVIFGGMVDSHHKCNDLYELDLDMMCWRVINVSENKPKPSPRYGHLQYVLGDRHILVIGGCGISNKPLTDAWVLDMGSGDEPWKWKEIQVLNEEYAAPVIFVHPACKVGHSISVFGKSKNPQIVSAMRRSHVIASAPRPPPPPQGPRVQRSNPSNARRELRNHGLLLNGSSKRVHSGGKPTVGDQKECQPSASSQDMQCQPSTSSQVCDELHTNNTSDATTNTHNLSDSSDVALATGASSSNHGNNLSAIKSDSSRPGATKDMCNNSRAKSSEASLLKSNLNHGNTGQLPNRKHHHAALNVAAKAGARECRCSKLPPPRKTALPKHLMQQYVLDTSEVLTAGHVKWQPAKDLGGDAKPLYRPIGLPIQHGMPPQTCFTSVCEGRAELVMFGGLLEDTCHLSTIGKRAVNNVYYAM